MKTIYIFKAEMDNSIHVCNDTDFGAFNRKQNKEISISPKLKIKPWELVCHFVFQREQSATDFEQYLKTKAGFEFANMHFFLNPLSELKKLLAILPKSTEFYVMGGLALDGHFGKISRRHDDLDLICWRKDIRIFKKALIQIGYKIRENYSEENSKLLRLIETDEEQPAIEVKIIDELPDNCFQFHAKGTFNQIFPKKLLGPKKVLLDGLKFPAISIQLIADLNNLNRQNLKKIKKENPKLYKVLGYKIDNIKKDHSLIKKLMSK